MNEPPPPYSVLQWPNKTRFVVIRSENGKTVQHVCWRESMEQALTERDYLNAAYMHGWRDRDEREGEDE